MFDQNNSPVAIEVPGEWILKKTFGPVLNELGEDMKRLYSKGRDNILKAGFKKISNKEDGKQANLRVARDVFWNGSFTDESICAEYFGGILASSRSDSGSDDSGVYFVDLIKSLSSYQLKLHYFIYSSLNDLLISDDSKRDLELGIQGALSKIPIYLSIGELNSTIHVDDFGRDLHAIHAKGLIGDFQTETNKLSVGMSVPYLKVSATPLGIQLYAVAFNKLDKWRLFAVTSFGNLEYLDQLKYRGIDLGKFLESTGISNNTEKV